MPRPFADTYTFNHAVEKDGSVTFECTQDPDIWPWLSLPPTHPILIQTVNFWASFDSGVFLDEFRADAWTALTRLEWTCGSAEVGLPRSGRYASFQEEDRARYTLQLRDEAGAVVADYAGQGVTFRTRNFENWRGKAKKKLRDPSPPTLDYAAAQQVGVARSSESFLAPLSRSQGRLATRGLITKENGLRPAHPYIGGSGDHVNSTHMGEIARQFGELLLDRPPPHFGGMMKLKHYVELGVMFEVALKSQTETAFEISVHQAGRLCAEVAWTYR
ncbi:MAG: hypothetical protein AAFZ74_08130 [Pseudomonadota bacterium]